MIVTPIIAAGVEIGTRLGTELLDRILPKKAEESGGIGFDSLMKGNGLASLDDYLSAFLKKSGVETAQDLTSLRMDLQEYLLNMPGVQDFLSGVPSGDAVQFSITGANEATLSTSGGGSMQLTGEMAKMAKRLQQLGVLEGNMKQFPLSSVEQLANQVDRSSVARGSFTARVA